MRRLISTTWSKGLAMAALAVATSAAAQGQQPGESGSPPHDVLREVEDLQLPAPKQDLRQAFDRLEIPLPKQDRVFLFGDDEDRVRELIGDSVKFIENVPPKLS